MFFLGKKPQRYITLTFDDGFINGARKIDKILHPHHVTFYIVTGWVEGSVPVTDKYNAGADHGTLEDWKDLAIKGHDIGSHTVSHTNADNAGVSIEALDKECHDSLQYIKAIHGAPYSLAFPHNKPYPITAPYDSIRLGYDGGVIYNHLESVDLKKIKSWSPWPESLWEKRIFWKIGRMPVGSWLVLGLHSLDGEGWHPWSSKSLARLKDFALRKGFQIRSMAEMTELIKNRN